MATQPYVKTPTQLLQAGLKAPQPQTLRFTSHLKLYGILSNDSPFDGELEGLLLREAYKHQQRPHLPPDIGEYILSVEKNIHSSDELLATAQQIRQLIADLDKFWVYTCGEPLQPVFKQFSFDMRIPGWNSNEIEIKDYLVANANRSLIIALADVKNQHWLSMPHFPLLQALRARDAYATTTPLLKALVDIHHSALKSPRVEGRLFSFANALETVRKLLPGKNDNAKQGSLAPDVLTHLKRSLHWLMHIANNRYNVRHILKKSRLPALNPAITDRERADFEHDADLIIRSFICNEFKIDCPMIKRP